MALSLLCGGLGVASAANSTVHVDESASGAAEVYTKTGVDTLLADYGRKTEVETNKNNIANLQTTTIDQGQKIATNTADIANHKTAIDKKIDTVTADARYAAKADLIAKADATALDDKADKTAVAALEGRVGNLETTVGNASSGLVQDVAELKTQGITLNNALGNKADQSDLDVAKAKITTNETNITALQKKTTGLSDDGKSLTSMNNVETGALKVTGQISNGTVTTTLTDINASMDKANANETAIGQLQTTTTNQQMAIDKLNEKTTDISWAAGDGTSISGVTIKNGNIVGNGNSAITRLMNVETNQINGKSLAGTTVATMTEVEAAVNTEKTAREEADKDLSKRIGTVDEDGKYIKKSTTNNVSENLKVLDNQAKTNAEAIAKETADRKTAIGELAVDGNYNYIEKDKNVSDNLVELDKQAKKNADNIQINKDAIAATDKRTGGIERETEGTKTTTKIEGNVTVDNSGNVGGVKKLSAETINTGKADIGTLNVTGESSLKNTKVEGTLGVTGATTLDGTLTANGEATFKKKVTMENELDVSDTDGNNKANLSVKAGEGVKASATDGTTKGSLDVKADEVKTEVKDDSTGNRTNTSQTADGIKGYATDKDGNKTYTKVTATENSFQIQDKDGKIKNHQVNTKDSSENTITNGDKTNTVTSTADGTTFKNSKANTAFEGGTYTDTTINGNTITTGQVKMDYAEVMKNLGVNGNAKIDGKTTTGSLEVTGTSTLKGDVTMGSNATVNGNFNVNGTTNLKDTNVGGKLDVTGKATFSDDVDIKKNLSVVGDVTANSYKVGDKTYISAAGINANDQKITNVADGSISEGSKDAVNGGQLYGVKRDLEHQVDKVGANAAAMANLRPMEFDPSSKWNIAAAIGNYGSETAVALGAFYRPNDDVMVNLSTAFGTGENMVGGGVSVRLGKSGNKLSREESNALKDQVNDLTARMDALLSVLNPNMSKDFPDVPENHWAYEAVSRLAGNDIVQGYPDGEFHGERTMTRYEMAEIIYNALSRGAEAEKELVEEFKPELQAMAASEKSTAEKAEG